VYCLGGDNPPRNCPSERQRSSPDYSKCVCEDGFYESATDVCTPCPAGNFCVGGTKEMCRRHTYQPNTQATTCIECVPGATEDGIYSSCGTGRQLAWCNPGKYTSLTENCKACSQCKHPFLPQTEEQFDCYRSN
jgi:hypothetical protein